MNDRIVEFPNRYELVRSDGSRELVTLTPSPGVVTTEGTRLNKHSLLQDDTANLYGLGADATPNDIFMSLKMPAGYYGFKVTAKFSDGTPASGLELKGLLSFDQSVPVTDESGFCYAMSADTAPVVDFTNYLGIVSKTETIRAVDGKTYTPVEIVVEKDTELHVLETSCEKRSYAGALFDFCAVGGGGGAGAAGADYNIPTGGGGGGYVTNTLGVIGGGVFSFVIGSGGAGSNARTGAAGGATSVTADGTSVCDASGGGGATYNYSGGTGAGGAGNGNGGFGGRYGTGANGADGSVRVFDDPSLPLPGGGGAGGYYSGDYSAMGTGGLDFGGDAVLNGSGQSGKGPGGGGGAGGNSYGSSVNCYGGNGHAGAVYVRARYA